MTAIHIVVQGEPKNDVKREEKREEKKVIREEKRDGREAKKVARQEQKGETGWANAGMANTQFH